MRYDSMKADVGFVGLVFEAKTGPLRVLKRVGYGKKSTALYEVEFLLTGHVTQTYKSNVEEGFRKG
jgi:hypothetical protein